jgi:flavorubredoxin/flavin reductase (DIM6/NTAB) family NADH-FMN oxidoreductase RutF
VQERPSTQLSEIEKWGQEKRLQTQVFEVADDTLSIRSLDWDRDRFDIEFGLQEGTTYNSYLIFGDKTALVDASHEKFRGLYMKTLLNELKKAGRSLDYVIVSHTEPDHSGLIPDIIDKYPQATVVGSRVALQYLQGLTNREFTQQAVKGGDKIDLGQGHSLEFFSCPNLHWPDTMFTYDAATGVLFTCDAFGLHYCSEEPFDTDLRAMEPHYRFYYDCLMKPNARSVLTALKRTGDLDINTIANGHGCLLRYNLSELVNRYRTWSEAVGKASASVAVLYSGSYGFSDRLSQTLARGITKAGVATEMVDVLSIDTQELVEIIGRSSGVVLLSPPTENKEAQKTLDTLLSAVNKKQKVLIAESYGGEDEPVDTLLNGFVGVGVEPALDPIRIKEQPDENTYQGFEEAGTRLAQVLTKKETIAKMKANMPADLAKALARVSGGLYVVTAMNRSARGAMLASWVAQASFEPLGLTVAVAKDRAIESLMQVGDKFALNCLEEGNYNANMKHFLKRFPPGADRLSGINWSPSENGCPVLEEGIVAYVDCEVVSRLETGDHWLTYAKVVGGSVINPDKKTAVHRRVVASYY